MSKEQIIPDLLHDPRTGRQGPWTVIYELECRVHCGSICPRMIRVICGLFLTDLAVVEDGHNPYSADNIAEGCRKQPVQVVSGGSRAGES
jgi:hypothetical protein